MSNPKKRLIALVFFLGVIFLESRACADYTATLPSPKGRSATAYASQSSSVNLYPLRVGDKLTIGVFKEDDLSGTYTVDSRGNISFPLLGDVKAEGLRVEELRDYLLEALGRDYLVNPQIKIEFQGGQNSFVSVLGQVARPGNFVLTSDKTLLSVISEAGGLTQLASNTIKLIRTAENGQKSTIQCDIKKILSGEQEDVPLKPDDAIYIDKKEEDFQATVTVLGQVNRPGNFTYSPDLTVTRAVSQAQGFTRFANASQVKITRTIPDKAVLQVNVNAITDGRADDVKLEQGDIIYVPESAF